MQNNRQKVGIALIILGLVLIGLIIYFGFIREDELEPAVTPSGEEAPSGQLPSGPETGTTTPSDRPSEERQYDISKEQPHKFNEADLAKRAMSYAARLGSYSSQSDYSNFTDLKMYMTVGMREWTDKEVASLKAKNSGSAYYGITTRALATETKSFDAQAGTAEITVITERSESTEAIGGGEPFRQSIDLKFVKADGEWLIDGAYWE